MVIARECIQRHVNVGGVVAPTRVKVAGNGIITAVPPATQARYRRGITVSLAYANQPYRERRQWEPPDG